MKPPFFITGLPRCRTAWLANLFTTDTSLCLHESAHGPEFLLARHPELRIGLSGPELVFRYRDLVQKFPEARWIYVDREVDQVLDSLVRYLGLERERARRMVAAHLEEAEFMAANPLVRHVQFDDLRREDITRSVWGWILPEARWNRPRWQLLEDLNVQAIKERRGTMVPLGDRGVLVAAANGDRSRSAV